MLLVGAAVLLLLFGQGFLTTSPVLADVHRIEEATDQILYQSRHTLRDRTNNTWQVILFKRIQRNELPEINLRLVGFPDTAQFAHPQPLQITTATGHQLTADDVFAEQSPAPNVGQYDFRQVLQQIQRNEFLKLTLPLTDSRSDYLNIPSFIVQEWQQVASSS